MKGVLAVLVLTVQLVPDVSVFVIMLLLVLLIMLVVVKETLLL
jgi:hypothetical protein